MLTSHFHEHGEQFVIRIAGGPPDGQVVYTSTDWSHPLITGRTLSFGLTSQHEMDIVFGYAY